MRGGGGKGETLTRITITVFITTARGLTRVIEQWTGPGQAAVRRVVAPPAGRSIPRFGEERGQDARRVALDPDSGCFRRGAARTVPGGDQANVGSIGGGKLRRRSPLPLRAKGKVRPALTA